MSTTDILYQKFEDLLNLFNVQNTTFNSTIAGLQTTINSIQVPNIQSLQNAITTKESLSNKVDAILSNVNSNDYPSTLGLVNYVSSLTGNLNNLPNGTSTIVSAISYINSQLTSVLAAYNVSTSMVTSIDNINTTLNTYFANGGGSNVNTSNLVSNTSLATTLAGYVTSSGLTSTLSSYALASSLSSEITNRSSAITALSNRLAVFESGISAIGSLSTLTNSASSIVAAINSITASSANYVTSSSLSTTLANYASTSSLGSLASASTLSAETASRTNADTALSNRIAIFETSGNSAIGLLSNLTVSATSIISAINSVNTSLTSVNTKIGTMANLPGATTDLVSAINYVSSHASANLTFTNGLINTSGTVTPTYGTTAGTFCQGNDSRLNYMNSRVFVTSTQPSTPVFGDVWINPTDPSTLVTGPAGPSTQVYITGGYTTFTYNPNNGTKYPSSVAPYTFVFTKNGVAVSSSLYSIAWALSDPTNSLFTVSGSTTGTSFAPTLNSTFDATKCNNAITLTITMNDGSGTYVVTQPISITQLGTNGANGTNGSIGSNGAAGPTTQLFITSNTTSFLYNAAGTSFAPAIQAFSFTFTQNGATVNSSNYTIAWSIPNSANSLLSGTSTAATFTPTLASNFNSALASNAVKLVITMSDSITIYQAIQPISITQVGATGATGPAGASGGFTRTSTTLMCDFISSVNTTFAPFSLINQYGNYWQGASTAYIDPNHPGVVTLNSGTSGNGNGIWADKEIMIFPTANTTNPTVYTYENQVMFPTLPSSNEIFIFGIYDGNTSGSSTNGIYFKNTGAVFTGYCNHSGSPYLPNYNTNVHTSTTFTVSANVWYTFQIVITTTYPSGGDMDISIAYNILNSSDTVVFTNTLTLVGVQSANGGGSTVAAIRTANGTTAAALAQYIPSTNAMPMRVYLSAYSTSTTSIDYIALDYLLYSVTNLVR